MELCWLLKSQGPKVPHDQLIRCGRLLNGLREETECRPKPMVEIGGRTDRTKEHVRNNNHLHDMSLASGRWVSDDNASPLTTLLCLSRQIV